MTRFPESLSLEAGPFRPNVAAMILRRHEGRVEILLGERWDTPGAWQWPQGGVEPGESTRAALHREIAEEVALRQVEVHYGFPFRLRYRFPQRLAALFAPCIGQEQQFFVVTTQAEPNLEEAEAGEFRRLRWFPLAEAGRAAVWFKAGVYATAVEHVLGRLATGELVLPNSS